MSVNLPAKPSLGDDNEASFAEFSKPGPKALRQMFEIALYWVVFWSIPITAGWAVAKTADEMLPSGYARSGAIGALLSGLIVAGIMSGLSDTPRGGKIACYVRAVIRAWAYPIILIAGVAIGRHWEGISRLLSSFNSDGW